MCSCFWGSLLNNVGGVGGMGQILAWMAWVVCVKKTQKKPQVEIGMAGMGP